MTHLTLPGMTAAQVTETGPLSRSMVSALDYQARMIEVTEAGKVIPPRDLF